MTLGARLAGIEVVAAVENDAHAARTYRHNNPEVPLVEDDISRYTSCPRVARGNVKILFGGAPCQGFSTSNQRTRSSANGNNWLFREFLRVALRWKPDWLVFENVKGIAETEKGVFLDRILAEVEAIGYVTSHGFLQAIDFGVPQRRTRLFIVASRHGIKASLPRSTHTKSPTVWSAISDLPLLENGAATSILPYRCKCRNEYQTKMRSGLAECANHLVSRNAEYVVKRYPYIPQGGNFEDIPKRLMQNYAKVENCHTGIYHRLQENEPSVVIGNYRKNMLIHPTTIQNQGLAPPDEHPLRQAALWRSLLGKDSTLTPQKIAEYCGISASRVRQILRLEKLDPRICDFWLSVGSTSLAGCNERTLRNLIPLKGSDQVAQFADLCRVFVPF